MPGVRNFVAKVRETCFIVDEPRCERACIVRTPDNIEAVAEAVRQSPSISTCHCLPLILRYDLSVMP